MDQISLLIVCCNWLKQSIMVGNIKKKKERQKKTKERVESLVMTVRIILKQPEKNAQRDPGEKGWACCYCGREGHLKQDCPQAF